MVVEGFWIEYFGFWKGPQAGEKTFRRAKSSSSREFPVLLATPEATEAF